MRIVNPSWISHGRERPQPCYACSVSPDGARLATAAGDGHVRIWSTDAIANASNPSYTKPRQLASLSYHSGTVHSVRFSPNGKYLASGADDKLVCIYTLEPGAPAATFGSKEAPQVENWRVFRRLNGHDNDVQDLGWSCDSSILVSVGLDSKVVVWSGSTFEKLKTLSNHQSHVKGICFDPANKYFATASDDRTIKIYRFTSPPPNATAYDQTSNFVLEATVSEPFVASPLTTYFRRCAWSPEGAHIAAANATNGPVSSVAIIERGNWASHINLIGHEGPVEVCAFSTRLFYSQPPPAASADGKDATPAAPAVSVIACAGQDKTISVWNTSLPRPLVTAAEACTKPVSDMVWSPDGETLYCASLDGSIVALIFEKGELGYPTSPAENEQRLAKFGAGRRAGIIEGPEALRLEEGTKAGELKVVEGRMGELMGDNSRAPALVLTNGDGGHKDVAPDDATTTTNGVVAAQAPKDLQQEKIEKLKNRVTYTKEGKKRIAPLLVSSSNVGEANLPRPHLQASVRQGGLSDEPAGKILDLSKPYDGLPKGGLASLLLGNKRKYAEAADEDDEERKRAEKRVHSIQQSGATPIVSNTADGLVPISSATAKKLPADTPEVLRPAIVNPSLTVSQVRLAVPSVRSVIVRPLDVTKPSADNENGDHAPTGSADGSANITFEARNASGPSRTGRAQDREPTRITLSKRNQTLWQDFLPRAVLLVTGNRNFWAAACEDGSLHLWTPAGRRLMNASVLESQPVILDCRGWWLLAITAAGLCYVWNVKMMSAPHPPISLAPALDAASSTMQNHLTAAPSLMFARLNSQGRVVIGMSNGDGFAYNPSMYVWQRLSESWWAVGSQYWNTTDTSIVAVPGAIKKSNGPSVLDEINPENISAGIIPLLERNTTSQALLKGRAYFLQRLVKQLLSAEGFEGFESSVSIAHLENRVAAAMSLAAKDEFRVYLLMYAKRLGAESARGKVEELLKGLTGNLYEAIDEDGEGGTDPDVAAGTFWGEGDELVGWNRQDLLREVVTALGKQRELQRILVPYAKLLQIVGGPSAKPDTLALENGEARDGVDGTDVRMSEHGED